MKFTLLTTDNLPNVGRLVVFKIRVGRPVPKVGDANKVEDTLGLGFGFVQYEPDGFGRLMPMYIQTVQFHEGGKALQYGTRVNLGDVHAWAYVQELADDAKRPSLPSSES